MPKDRPWHRPQPGDIPGLPQTEDAIGPYRYKGADILNMTDAQIREFCLQKAKLFLYESQVKAGDTLVGAGSDDLAIAVRYATIAEAFGAGPEAED
jgi:hypothetical protein